MATTTGRISLALILLASLLLIAAGIAMASVESRAFFSTGVTARERFEVIADGRTHVGLSSASEMLVLTNCYEALDSILAHTKPRVERDKVAANCLAIADGIVARAPAHPFAWYIGALAAADLGDEDGLSFRLGRSQATGPSEQWIAERRVDTAEDHLASLAPDVREAHDRDLVMLVRSRRGVDAIARRYVRQADFRERITALVEQLDPEAKRRFLDYVRDAARVIAGA